MHPASGWAIAAYRAIQGTRRGPATAASVGGRQPGHQGEQDAEDGEHGVAMDSYVLRRGRIGALRLRVLAGAAEPATRQLLDRLPWRPHRRSLDVGCGLGLVTAELARRRSGAVGLDCCLDFCQGCPQAGATG